MDDELTFWCQKWLAKGESPKELARLLQVMIKEMNCRAKAEEYLNGDVGESGNQD